MHNEKVNLWGSPVTKENADDIKQKQMNNLLKKLQQNPGPRPSSTAAAASFQDPSIIMSSSLPSNDKPFTGTVDQPETGISRPPQQQAHPQGQQLHLLSQMNAQTPAREVVQCSIQSNSLHCSNLEAALIAGHAPPAMPGQLPLLMGHNQQSLPAQSLPPRTVNAVMPPRPPVGVPHQQQQQQPPQQMPIGTPPQSGFMHLQVKFFFFSSGKHTLCI